MKKEKNQDRDIVLSYIDKTHISLQAIGKKLNRTIIFLFLVNVLLLAIHFNLISISNSIPFLGLVIQVPTVILTIVLCICSYFLQVYMFGLGVKESENSDMIVNLYKKTGFYHESMNSEDACVLEYPHILSISFSKRINKNKKGIGMINDFAFIISSFMLLIMTPVVIGIITYNSWVGNFFSIEFFIYISILVLSLINFVSGIIKANTL